MLDAFPRGEPLPQNTYIPEVQSLGSFMFGDPVWGPCLATNRVLEEEEEEEEVLGGEGGGAPYHPLRGAPTRGAT